MLPLYCFIFSEFKRYHVDSKKNIYPHLVPGVISDKLREALGIGKDQLPPYIYRMRSIGYPPGWLLNAKMDYSGIEMFDSEGNSKFSSLLCFIVIKQS